MMILNLMKFQGVTKALSIHRSKDMNLLQRYYMRIIVFTKKLNTVKENKNL